MATKLNNAGAAINQLVRPQDLRIWRAAQPWLDVRSNNEHTLIAYGLARALLLHNPEADADIVLPAVLLHDVGWKMFPPEKLAGAVGPRPIYPELVRGHEIEGTRIAREILAKFSLAPDAIEPIAEIIDGHDTRNNALSLNDALMKDADKLWRFTSHGIRTIGGWHAMSDRETVRLLTSSTLPRFISNTAKIMASALVAECSGTAWMSDFLGC
jgi:HD domain